MPEEAGADRARKYTDRLLSEFKRAYSAELEGEIGALDKWLRENVSGLPSEVAKELLWESLRNESARTLLYHASKRGLFEVFQPHVSDTVVNHWMEYALGGDHRSMFLLALAAKSDPKVARAIAGRATYYLLISGDHRLSHNAYELLSHIARESPEGFAKYALKEILKRLAGDAAARDHNVHRAVNLLIRFLHENGDVAREHFGGHLKEALSHVMDHRAPTIAELIKEVRNIDPVLFSRAVDAVVDEVVRGNRGALMVLGSLLEDRELRSLVGPRLAKELRDGEVLERLLSTGRFNGLVAYLLEYHPEESKPLRDALLRLYKMGNKGAKNFLNWLKGEFPETFKKHFGAG